MTARRATMIGSAAATAVVLALAAGGSESAVPSEAATSPTVGVGVKERQKVAVEKCATRSQASFPGAFTDRRNLVVGPLALFGAGKARVYFFPTSAATPGDRSSSFWSGTATG